MKAFPVSNPVQPPSGQRLTFIGKAYDVTYVRLKFNSPRPASFAIYKKSRINPGLPDENPEEGWIPWQYYSVSCMDRYDTPDSTSIIQPRDRKIKIAEDRALCTSEYSDMTPLTGANVAFATLEGRPSAFNFEYSPGKREISVSNKLKNVTKSRQYSQSCSSGCRPRTCASVSTD